MAGCDIVSGGFVSAGNSEKLSNHNNDIDLVQCIRVTFGRKNKNSQFKNTHKGKNITTGCMGGHRTADDLAVMKAFLKGEDIISTFFNNAKQSLYYFRF